MAHLLSTVRTDAVVLFVLTAFALVLVTVAVKRRHVAGATTFAWLMVAVAVWQGLSAVHRLLTSTDARILTAQFQYLGISAVPPLWFLFCRTYARRSASRPALNLAVWIIPVFAVIAVFTNEMHNGFWRSVTPVSGDPADGLVYSYGPFFWVAAGYAYLLVIAGTWEVTQSLREHPPQYRSQSIVLTVGALIPVIANALYVTKLVPDFTPMAFAVSGGIFGWSLFRNQLLNLTPIARGVLFDRLGDAVFVLDTGYRVLDVNSAGRKLVGLSSGVGMPIVQLLPWWQSLAAGDTRSSDRPAVVRYEGTVLDVAVTPVAESEGTLGGWLVVVRDVTKRQRQADERVALERRLQEQQHLESLTLLAGGLAHDFNNLLTGIQGNADLLAMRLPPDATDLRDMVRTITVGAERAADLVAKMQAYSGQGGQPYTPVDLSSLVREMVDLLRASVAKHCQLVAHLPQGPLPSVQGDPTQMRQVILNLIVNAAESVEATGERPRSGVVTVRAVVNTIPNTDTSPPVAPPTLDAGTYVRLEVSDTGSGMDDATRTRMFDPFFSTKESGRGLGLAAVLGIVRRHGGTIGVHSIPEVGTTIRLWLPTP